MADTRRRLAALPDPQLELALVQLGGQLAWPTAGTGPVDIAGRVRQRLETGIEAPRPGLLQRLGLGRRARPGDRGRVGGSARRALVLAVVGLLAIAVVAGAIGVGLPGLRIILGGPTPSLPAPTARPTDAAPGAFMGLGTPTTLDDARPQLDFDILVPDDPAVGAPDAVYLSTDRIALAWAPRAGLPDAENDGVGLLVTEYDGRIGSGYVEKLIQSGTILTPVTVDGARGYWIAGGPHFFRYVDRTGRDVEDTHRAVGDTLVWTVDGVTYRIESSLGREATIALALTFG